jgi:hypothetical protein
MESAGWIRRSGVLNFVDAIPAIASAHIAHSKYYRVGKFRHDISLSHQNVG